MSRTITKEYVDARIYENTKNEISGQDANEAIKKVIDDAVYPEDLPDFNSFAPISHVGSRGTTQHQLGNGTSSGFSTNDYTTAEKTKLSGIATGANNYQHPSFTNYVQGFYKIITTAEGHVSSATPVTKSDITALGIPAQDTTYSVVSGTGSNPGLMSVLDKQKLDNLSNISIVQNTGGSTSAVMSQDAVTRALSQSGAAITKGTTSPNTGAFVTDMTVSGHEITLQKDGAVKIPLSQLPDVILGQLIFGGTFVPTTSTATLTTDAQQKLGTSNISIVLTNNTTAVTGYEANKGIYYISSTSGNLSMLPSNPSDISSMQTGDWILSTGTGWQKISNSDAVTGVKGDSESTYRIGNVNLTAANVGAQPQLNGSGFVRASGTVITYETINVPSAANLTSQSATLGQTASDGILPTYSRSDHYHALPKLANLIFTGAAVGTYNGTGNLTIEIPSGGGGSYTLPPATTSSLGGIIVGTGLSITSNGTLSSSIGFTNLPTVNDGQVYGRPVGDSGGNIQALNPFQLAAIVRPELPFLPTTGGTMSGTIVSQTGSQTNPTIDGSGALYFQSSNSTGITVMARGGNLILNSNNGVSIGNNGMSSLNLNATTMNINSTASMTLNIGSNSPVASTDYFVMTNSSGGVKKVPLSAIVSMDSHIDPTNVVTYLFTPQYSGSGADSVATLIGGTLITANSYKTNEMYNGKQVYISFVSRSVNNGYSNWTTNYGNNQQYEYNYILFGNQVSGMSTNNITSSFLNPVDQMWIDYSQSYGIVQSGTGANAIPVRQQASPKQDDPTTWMFSSMSQGVNQTGIRATLAGGTVDSPTLNNMVICIKFTLTQ